MGAGRNENGQFTQGNTFGGAAKTKYGGDMPERLIQYFKVPAVEVRYTEKLDKDGNIVERIPYEVACEYPTFEGFAASVGVCIRTLENWRDRHKRFAEAYELCTTIQKNLLIVNSMRGRYNSTFAKFIAVNHHGMKDKIVEELDASDGLEVSIRMVDSTEKV